jgi:hypothetical protein
MASKVETRASIVSLSKELNLEVPADLEQIDKLVDLESMLKSLEDKKAALAPLATGTTPAVGSEVGGIGAPPPPPSELEPPAPKKVVATTYLVNEGKSVTTKRGVIGALEHVWPKDFDGGQRDLDHWVTHSYVTKTDHYEQ